MPRFIVFSFLLIITGCGFNDNDSVNNLRHPPSMYAIIDKQEYSLETGSFSWEMKNGGTTKAIQTDAPSPNQIAKKLDPIKVEDNSDIEFTADYNPEIVVYLWDEEKRMEEIPSKNNQIQAPNKGKVIYEVIGEWPNGEAHYTFVVEVK